jgi:6-phosphogluconolactonase
MEEQRLTGFGAEPVSPRSEPTGRREIRIVEDAAAVSRAAAEEVTAALSPGRERESAGRITCALSGGSTPRSLYQLLADPASPYRDRIAWEAIHFFWGDERHVPPDDPDSNFRMAREAMLDRVPVPAAHIHRVAGEEPDAARAAERYEREMLAVFQLEPDRGGPPSAARLDWPRFDLVLLGLGEEGHTASLFPGGPLLAERRRLAAAVWVAAHDTWRITLTPPVINHAAVVIFLVSGAAKAAALAAVLEGRPEPERYPAQVVAPVDGRVLWIADRAAAGDLRRTPP